ncbi:hypothetical protein VTI28DRAFT_3165 [Corynascus sepedonium]
MALTGRSVDEHGSATESVVSPSSSVGEMTSSGTLAVSSERTTEGRADAVQKPNEKPFKFNGQYAFVTYNHSRVEDHEAFYRYLRDSIAQRLMRVGGQPMRVQYFGAQERHATGESHYHVLIRFSQRVHWRNARTNFSVLIPKEGSDEKEVDTWSFRINTMRNRQSRFSFVNSVEAVIAKCGPEFLFGESLAETTGLGDQKRKRKRVAEEAIAAPTAEEADRILREGDPESYVWRHPAVAAFLRCKRPRLLEPHQPSFKPGQWKVPKQLLKWKHRNVLNKPEGRPQAVLLIGPPRTGKTEWARSFGLPCVMTHGWSYDAYDEDCTHVVLNDICLSEFPYWRVFLGGQSWLVSTGKYRPETRRRFGKPVIWTCNFDNDPRRNKEVAKYIASAGVLVVTVHKRLFQAS